MILRVPSNHSMIVQVAGAVDTGGDEGKHTWPAALALPSVHVGCSRSGLKSRLGWNCWLRLPCAIPRSHMGGAGGMLPAAASLWDVLGRGCALQSSSKTESIMGVAGF